MNTKAKFTCDSVTKHVNYESIKLIAVTNDNTKENADFWKYTPSGELNISICNEKVFGFFKPGKDYYLDISEA